MTAPTKYELDRLRTAKQHGFALFGVAADEHAPAFVYTVGMAQHNLPDLITFIPSADDSKLMFTMIVNMACWLKEFRQKFPNKDFRILHGVKKLTVDPQVEYTFNILDPAMQRISQLRYTCRAGYFAPILGRPTICELQYEGMPTMLEIERQSLERAFDI